MFIFKQKRIKEISDYMERIYKQYSKNKVKPN